MSSNLVDIGLNIIGFMPFGFFLAAWLHRTKHLSPGCILGISLFLGFSFSLGLELTQAFLPTRDSSLMDVISNTVGTGIGSILVVLTMPVGSIFSGTRPRFF